MNKKQVQLRNNSETKTKFTLNESKFQSKRRLIFEVHEGHNSKQTSDKYRVYFRYFLDYIRYTDLDVLLDLGKEAIQELVIKYAISLRDNPEKKYSRSTVTTRIAAILYFLDNNYIKLNRRKIMTSSGVRIGALASMQIGDLIKTPVKFNNSIFKVQVYARTRKRYFTFTTPECYNAIQEYLNYRKRCGEEIKDKSPLFRKHFNKHDPFTINVPRFITDDAVMKSVDEVLTKSGVKSTDAMCSHAFRKGLMSICEQKGMKSINVKKLLGHDIGVSGHYYRPAESDILEDYMTHAADALTIDPNQRLEQENQELKTVQAEEIARLNKKWITLIQ